MIDIILLILLLSIFFISRINDNDNIGDYLSVYNSILIKGFLSLSVLFGHLSYFFKDSNLLMIFQILGRTSVGIFFFLSSYGLTKQYITKENYHVHFLSKRFAKVLIPYLVLSFIYWLYYAVQGNIYNISEIISLLLVGEPLVSYSWYIIDILVLYFFFYIFMIVSKSNKKLFLLLNTIVALLLAVVLKSLNFGMFWYSSLHMYLIGIVYALYQKKMDDFTYKNRFLLFISSIIIIILTIINGDSDIHISIIQVAYLILIIFLLQNFNIKNTTLSFLGKISMEIYMVHGLIIKIYRYYISDNSSATDLLAILFLTIIISLIFNKLFNSKFIIKNQNNFN